MSKYIDFDRFADEACIMGEASFADEVTMEKGLYVCGEMTVDGRVYMGQGELVLVLSGEGEPEACPSGAGQLYIDTEKSKVYIATCENAHLRWRELVLK